MFGMEWTTASLTMQLTSGVDVFAHVCEQTLDNLSNSATVVIITISIQPYE